MGIKKPIAKYAIGEWGKCLGFCYTRISIILPLPPGGLAGLPASRFFAGARLCCSSLPLRKCFSPLSFSLCGSSLILSFFFEGVMSLGIHPDLAPAEAENGVKNHGGPLPCSLIFRLSVILLSPVMAFNAFWFRRFPKVQPGGRAGFVDKI